MKTIFTNEDYTYNKKIIVPEGVTVIAANCFKDVDVEEVVLPSTLLQIGDCAFFNTKIKALLIPKSVIIVGAYAFANNTLLQGLHFEKGSRLSATGDLMCKNCSRLKRVTLPENLAKIAIGSFSNCPFLTSITIPKTTKLISTMAFHECYRLKEVTLLASGCHLQDYSFAMCNRLAKVISNSYSNTADELAFCGCENDKTLLEHFNLISHLEDNTSSC